MDYLQHYVRLRVGSDGHLHLEYMVEAPGDYGRVEASIDLTAHIKDVIREAVAEAIAARAADRAE